MKKMIVVVFVMLFSMVSAHEMMIVGHRGACGYEPENTLSSFQRALDVGVAMIELDVYVCATGELVVMHDDGVERTTNGHGNVVDMTFAQLRSLVVEGKEKIPTVAEVIDLLDRRVPLNIELKGPGTARPVAQLLNTYFERGWTMDDFVVSSFDHLQIDTFHQLLPAIKTGVLFGTTVKDKLRAWCTGWLPATVLNYVLSSDAGYMVQAAQRHQANFIGVGLNVVTPEIVQAAHHAGFPVFVWTVNDKKTADRLRAISVDGIFSNYPDRA